MVSFNYDEFKKVYYLTYRNEWLFSILPGPPIQNWLRPNPPGYVLALEHVWS